MRLPKAIKLHSHRPVEATQVGSISKCDVYKNCDAEQPRESKCSDRLKAIFDYTLFTRPEYILVYASSMSYYCAKVQIFLIYRTSEVHSAIRCFAGIQIEPIGISCIFISESIQDLPPYQFGAVIPLPPSHFHVLNITYPQVFCQYPKIPIPTKPEYIIGIA